MSIREILAGGGGVKSIQTGYVSSASLTTGTGEDSRYLNVTISAVSNMAKCVVEFIGSGAGGESDTGGYYAASASQPTYIAFPRLTTASNLRIGCKSVASNDAGGISGRWTVVEYK